MAEGERSINVNELLANQARLEEKVLADKKREEDDRIRQQKARDEAEEGLKERANALDEARRLDYKIASQEGITTADTRAKEIERELPTLEQRYSTDEEAAKALIVDRNMLQKAADDAKSRNLPVSQELIDGIEAISSDLSELVSSLKVQQQTLSVLREEKISTAGVLQEYKTSKARLDELTKRIEILEADPNIIEVLREEAEFEDTLMNQVIATAERLGDPRQTNPILRQARGDYVARVCRRYFQEEIESLELNNKELDPKERRERMKKLTTNLIDGLNAIEQRNDVILSSGFSVDKNLNENDKRDKNSGIALANLLGCYIKGEYFPVFLSRIESDNDRYINRDDRFTSGARQIKKHLKTINMIKAMSGSLGGYSSGILRLASVMNNVEDSYRYQELDFLANPNQPIIPKDASEEERKQIVEEFEIERNRGLETYKSLYDKEWQEKISQLEALTAELEKMEQQREEISQSREIVSKVGSSLRAKDIVLNLERDIERERVKLRTLEVEINDLKGLFSAGKRKELTRSYEQLDSDIRRLEAQLSEASRLHDETERAERHLQSTGGAFIERDIESRKKLIADLESHLDFMKQNYSKTIS